MIDTHQLHALLIRAFDGVQMGGKRPAGQREVTDETLAGIWWTLLVVSRAMEGHEVALGALERLAEGDIDLTGGDDACPNCGDDLGGTIDGGGICSGCGWRLPGY